MPQLFDDLFYIPPVVDEQRTVAVAVVLADLLNGEGNTEGITFQVTLMPEFRADELPTPKALVFPSGLLIEQTARVGLTEDHAIEIGIGRKVVDGEEDGKTHVKLVQEVIDILKRKEYRVLEVMGEKVYRRSIESTLFIPEKLRQRVALSVIRWTYREFT